VAAIRFKPNRRYFLVHKLEIPNGLIAAGVVLFAPALLIAQHDRISGPIERTKTVVLKGNINPEAQPQFDRGPIDSSLKLDLMTLALKPTPLQQANLERLLNEQQDRLSPIYHRWLTPEQYAERFGVSPKDISKVKAWLESQGFAVTYVARGRNWLTFSGAAAQVSKAFRVEIHRYEVDGVTHFANATEPSITVALEPMVLALLGLDDFHQKPPQAPLRTRSRHNPAKPEITAPDGTHYLAPDDIATIYDIRPIYQAGFDGSGQRLVVIGQSDVNLADIAAFRSRFGLPKHPPQVLLVPGSPDPGTSGGNMGEADLDIEWSGSVARNSTIIYVNSLTESNSKLYAIDQNLAPVLSQSYGNCEQVVSLTDAAVARSLAQQANAEGITVLTASGDSGAAACDKAFNSPEATGGFAVSFPASIPEITAVGGTQFTDGGGNYWNNTNSATGGSALSYIPEASWNESGASGLASSGGGFSTFYTQPS